MSDAWNAEGFHVKFGAIAVIVLYKMLPSNSRAVETIQAAIASLPRGTDAVRALLYDNTPGGGDPGSLPVGVQYEAAGRNRGLATAYNRALELAQYNSCPWLLLLDQDTVLPENFLESLLDELAGYEANTEIAAVVPIVKSGGVVVSPKKVGFFGLKAFMNTPRGIQDGEIMSINSGTAIRCDFVRSIGGFSRTYWLDYLDHWLFRQIYASGKKVAVSDCTLEHDLSVQDYRRNIDLARYQSILTGEAAFMTTHKSKVQIPFYLLILLLLICASMPAGCTQGSERTRNSSSPSASGACACLKTIEQNSVVLTQRIRSSFASWSVTYEAVASKFFQ